MRLTITIAVMILLATPVQTARAQTTRLALPPSLPVRNTTIILKVPHYAAARDQVLEVARMQGGQLTDARELVDPKGRYHGWVRLQVPDQTLPSLVVALYGVGKLYAEKITSTDNLSDYESLAHRIDSLKLHEQRLDSILQSPRHMRGNDILYLQERLFRANVDQGLLFQQRVDYARAAQVSSVQVELFEPGTMPSQETPHPVNLGQWFAAGMGRARLLLNHQMARVATAGAYALTYAPFWVPLLVIAVLVLWVLWRLARRYGPAAFVSARKWLRRAARIARHTQIPGFGRH